MTGPVSSVKEQTLPHYAQRFADAGYTVITFDPRGFGESGGAPRFHYDPWLIVSDYVNAAAYTMARADVDSGRVAAVGVCMGGGYALATAARERRLAACASIAGGYDIGGTFQRVMGGLREALSCDDALALVAEAAFRRERLEHRPMRFLELEEQRVVVLVAHQQEHERLGAHGAHADHLACEVHEAVAR
jgi:pimeloyl-ACP methyl ester carboxylesterase